MKEIWKDINGYEGKYQVSNRGRVKGFPRPGSIHHKPYIKKTFKNSKGYVVVMLSNKSVKGIVVHKLVAQLFIDNPLNKPTVNHKNGIKDDNRVENLEWLTHKENTHHAWKNGLCHKRFGLSNSAHKLNDKNIISIRKSKLSARELSNIFNVTIKSIYNIIHRKTWNHIK